MMIVLNEEWVIALLLPLLLAVSEAMHTIGGRYRTYATTRCIAHITALLMSDDEPQDEIIHKLRLHYTNATIVEAVIFISEHIYGGKLHRLALIVEVCEIDFMLQRAAKRKQGGARAIHLLKMSQLSHLGTLLDYTEEETSNDKARFYATMSLVASHPERAIRYIARLDTRLSLHEVVVLTRLMQRSGSPIAYTPLLISENRNLQYIGIYLCELLAIVDAERYLQLLAESKDCEIALAALQALCTLRGDLKTSHVRLGVSRLAPHLRAAFLRHAVQSCYSLRSCAHLLNNEERTSFSQHVGSYKCQIVCN